jgi:hypothetical protein
MTPKDLPLLLEEDDGEALAAAALALPPAAPPADLRARLMASATSERGARFARFVDRIAAMIDLGREKVSALVGAIDDATSWVPGPGGATLFHLPFGPRLEARNVGFVKLPPGAEFPPHRHDGWERTFCLQGSFAESNGAIRHPGDEVFMDDASEHSFVVRPGPDLIYLAILQRGILFADGKPVEI